MLVWLAPIVVFGLVVFVHEFGHFIAAKLFGVYAPRFSIGFGPALLKWRSGETEYKLAALPLGGYVRMASRLDEQSAFLEGGGEETAVLPPDYDPNAMIPFGPKPIPEDRWFESKPLYARLIILCAGVTMNVLLGWTLNIAITKTYGRDLTTRISEVVPGHPAALAGVKVGDSIVSVNDHPVHQWEWLLGYISRSVNVPLRFQILRNGQLRPFVITPSSDSVYDPETGKKVLGGKVGMGATANQMPFSEAFVEGTKTTGEMAGLVFTALQGIATRKTSVSELAGPIAIAQSSVQAARQGGEFFLPLIALISINLAIFNLLPIPILDGGQIVVQVVESARGRPLTDQAREYVARIGLAFILLLFLTVTFNDLKRLILGMLTGGKG